LAIKAITTQNLGQTALGGKYTSANANDIAPVPCLRLIEILSVEVRLNLVSISALYGAEAFER